MGGIMKVVCLSCIGLLMGGVDAIPMRHYENQHSTTSVEYRLPIIQRREPVFQNETKSTRTMAETSKTSITSLVIDSSSTLEKSTSVFSSSNSASQSATSASTPLSSSSFSPGATISETSLAPEASSVISVGPTSTTAEDGSRTMQSSSTSRQPSPIIPTQPTYSTQDAPQPSISVAISSATPSFVESSLSSPSGGQVSLPLSASSSLGGVSQSQSTLASSNKTPSGLTPASASPLTRSSTPSSALLMSSSPLNQPTSSTVVSFSKSQSSTSSNWLELPFSSSPELPSSLKVSAANPDATATPIASIHASTTASPVAVSSLSLQTTSIKALETSASASSSSVRDTSTLVSSIIYSTTANVKPISLVSSQNSFISIPSSSASAPSSVSSVLILTSSSATTAAPTPGPTTSESSLAKVSASRIQTLSIPASLISSAISEGNLPTSATSSFVSLSEESSSFSIATPIRSEVSLSSTNSPLPEARSTTVASLSSSLGALSTTSSSSALVTTESAQTTSLITIVSPLSSAIPSVSSGIAVNDTKSMIPTPVILSELETLATPTASFSSIADGSSSYVLSDVTGNATTSSVIATLEPSIAMSSSSATLVVTVTSQYTASVGMSLAAVVSSVSTSSTTPTITSTISLQGNMSMSYHNAPSQTFDASKVSESASGLPTAVSNSASTSIIMESESTLSRTSVKDMTSNTSSIPVSQTATATSLFLLSNNLVPIPTESSTTRPLSELLQPSNVNKTASHSSLVTPTSNNYSAMSTATTFVTLTSAQISATKDSQSTFTGSMVRPSVSNSIFSTRPSTTLIPIPPPLPSASQSIILAAAPNRPNLTPSQTAGVAAASFAGVLLAAVAVVFLLRRYHSAHTARPASTSTGSSVYPREAYLYDPPLDRGSTRDGGGDDDALAFMSGGAGGLPPQGALGAISNTTETTEEPAGNTSPFSDPGNPFRSPGGYTQASETVFDSSLHASVEATAALETLVNEPQYAMISHWSPSTSVSSSPRTMFHEHVIPSPSLSPFIGSLRRSHARAGSSGSVRSRRQLVTASAYSAPSVTAPSHRPRSLHGRLSSHSASSPRESGVSDPFEHDLLLPIDSWTETRDSAIVCAPSPMSTAPRLPLLPRTAYSGDVPVKPPFTRFNSNNPYRLQSTSAESPAADIPEPLSAQEEPVVLTAQPVTSTSPTNTLLEPKSPKSPISPPYAPTHLGWDDIKRLSKGSSTLVSPMSPAVSYTVFPRLSPSPSANTPPKKKKKSLIQLRRKEVPLSSISMPKSPVAGLNIMIPFGSKCLVGFEGPKESLLARVNSLASSRGSENGKGLVQGTPRTPRCWEDGGRKQ